MKHEKEDQANHRLGNDGFRLGQFGKQQTETRYFELQAISNKGRSSRGLLFMEQSNKSHRFSYNRCEEQKVKREI